MNVRTPALLALFLILSAATGVYAQTVIVTDDATYTTGQASAVLDIKSISKGLLIPRATTAQRTAISSPAEGLLVYQTDGTKGFYYYTNGAWTLLTSAGAGWSLTGNAGTSYATNFLGTTDNTSLRFRTNNNQVMILDSMGNLGVGIAPASPLHVYASNGNLLYLQTTTSGTAGIIFKTYPSAANPGAQISVIDTSFSDHITFSTKTPGADANALSERMRINALGNVGIGTTTPAQKLDVKGTIVSSATTYPNYAYNSANRMAFGESNVPANETGSVVQYGSGSNTRNMLFAFTKTNINTSYLGNDGTQMMLGSEATIPITFRSGLVYTSTNVMASGTELMRLTSAGFLGIGTTTPATTLHVIATSNPLTLYGVQAGATTDSILTIASGTVRKLPFSTVTSNSSWSLTGNTGTNYATNFLGTTDNTSLRFRTNNTLGAILDSTGNFGVGSSIAFTSGAAEKLLVNAGTTTSFNAVVAKGSVNNYFQLNINNTNSGSGASSDLVATADNGTETQNYVDLGINSSTYNTSSITGGPDNAYLYSASNDFVIGNATTAKNLIFFTGGTASTNEAMRINGSGYLGIGKTNPVHKIDIHGAGSIDSTLSAPNYTTTVQTLTSGTITWDQTKGATASVTLTGNSTLTITNASAGMYGLIKVQQDATGSRTLTLPSGSKVINGGGGVVTLTTTANAIDVLSYYYDGTNYYWTVGYNYN